MHADEPGRTSGAAGAARATATGAGPFGPLGALSAGVAVAAGAFGAHALRASLTPAQLTTFETAARYQMFHALALLVVALALGQKRHPAGARAGGLFIGGTILFSGSLYALALTHDYPLGTFRIALGVATPLGGLFFIAGWLSLAWGLWRGRRS